MNTFCECIFEIFTYFFIEIFLNEIFIGFLLIILKNQKYRPHVPMTISMTSKQASNQPNNHTTNQVINQQEIKQQISHPIKQTITQSQDKHGHINTPTHREHVTNTQRSRVHRKHTQ